MDFGYICENHAKTHEKHPLSPARYKCNQCNRRKVNGYSNPNHVCNPFGYLYLAPMICIECSIQMKQCMWCYEKDAKCKS